MPAGRPAENRLPRRGKKGKKGVRAARPPGQNSPVFSNSFEFCTPRVDHHSPDDGREPEVRSKERLRHIRVRGGYLGPATTLAAAAASGHSLQLYLPNHVPRCDMGEQTQEAAPETPHGANSGCRVWFGAAPGYGPLPSSCHTSPRRVHSTSCRGKLPAV